MYSEILLQSYSIDSIEMGTAVLIVGLFGLILYAAVVFRNPAAVVLWAVTVLLFLFSLLFDIGTELVWLAMILSVIVVTIGIVARWVN